MATYSNLREFLEANKADGCSTHTSMNGGSYFIGEDNLDTFYRLYYKAVDNGQGGLYLVEKSTDIGPCRVDFDFIYDKSVTTHVHTREQVKTFTRAYLNAISEFVVLPPNVDVYVMEKEEPTYNKKKDVMKSGIHILVPDIRTYKCVEQRVRRSLLSQMSEFFPGLPLLDSWDKVYDEAVVNRSAPWTMYKSKKPDNIDPSALEYKIRYILKWDGKDFELSDGQPPVTVDIIKRLSIRRQLDDKSPFTEEGEKLYSSIRSTGSDGIRTVAKRGRPMGRLDKPSSRASSPSANIMQQLDPEKRNCIRDHIMNLSTTRADEYHSWINVAQCLYNIHPDLLDVFLDFSAQCGDKYNEGECIKTWNALTFRNDGDERLTEASLKFWSRTDNLNGYIEIEERNIDGLMKKACSLTEYDCAALIYGIYSQNYKCSDFKFNVWYKWAGHVWRETDSGVDLLLRFSKEVASRFFKKAGEVHKYMEENNLLDCLSPVEKKDCGKCEYCVFNQEKEAFERVFKNLKKTGFKSNVMKECRELFFDEYFNKKIDGNKDLIAFNNGVLDLITYEFRAGRPDDYMSFSTGIDYYPDRPYYEYAEWPNVEKFLKQVLPKKEVREYFIKHLASNLFGGNPAQKFHILTGSGSNGKSMIMNLMTKALGDYACTVPISLLTQKRKGSGSAAPEVSRLKGRRFVTMQEPDEQIALNTGLMKEISSGEKMYARDLFKSGGEFEVLAKFHLACNEKPKVNTADGGTWRRLVVIAFLSKFVINPSSPNEYPLDESIQFSVSSVEWATPFLSYLVHILKEGNGLRKLTAPSDVLEYTSDYRNENDSIAKFISERVELAEDGEETIPIDKTTIRRIFKQWKDENDQRGLLPLEMEKRMEAQFGKYPRGGWKNIKILDG